MNRRGKLEEREVLREYRTLYRIVFLSFLKIRILFSGIMIKPKDSFHDSYYEISKLLFSYASFIRKETWKLGFISRD